MCIALVRRRTVSVEGTECDVNVCNEWKGR